MLLNQWTVVGTGISSSTVALWDSGLYQDFYCVTTKLVKEKITRNSKVPTVWIQDETTAGCRQRKKGSASVMYPELTLMWTGMFTHEGLNTLFLRDVLPTTYFTH